MGLRLAEGIDPERFTALAGRSSIRAHLILRDGGAVETTATVAAVTQAAFRCSTRWSPIWRHSTVIPDARNAPIVNPMLFLNLFDSASLALSSGRASRGPSTPDDRYHVPGANALGAGLIT